MRRKLFNFAVAISAALCIATFVVAQISDGWDDWIFHAPLRSRPAICRRCVQFGKLDPIVSLPAVAPNTARACHYPPSYGLNFPRPAVVELSPRTVVWSVGGFEKDSGTIIQPTPYATLLEPTIARRYEMWAIPCWFVTACFAALPIGRFLMIQWRQCVRTIRQDSGQCPTCGYDLRVTPDRCPECGAVKSTA